MRVCSRVCTHGHMLTRACTHSPVLRKSKIAVSLNSFPLAAWTAFVLQTKRKRNGRRTQNRREKEGGGPGNTQRKGESEGRAGRGSEREGKAETNRPESRKEPFLLSLSVQGPRPPRCQPLAKPLTNYTSVHSPTKHPTEGHSGWHRASGCLSNWPQAVTWLSPRHCCPSPT